MGLRSGFVAGAGSAAADVVPGACDIVAWLVGCGVCVVCCCRYGVLGRVLGSLSCRVNSSSGFVTFNVEGLLINKGISAFVGLDLDENSSAPGMNI